MRNFLAVFFFGCFFLLLYSPARAQYTYSAPSNFTQTPLKPEILAREARIVRKGEFDLFVEQDTTPWDAYISYGYTTKIQPIRLCRYWQVSDVYEFKLRSHFNNAVIEPQKDTLVNFHYDVELLKVFPFIYFPENSLKIVESDDSGQSWTMLQSSTVDTVNHTISAITKLNRGYMVVTGFVNPKIFCNYENTDVMGVSTVPTVNYPGSSLYYYGQFLYSIIIDMLRFRSEQAML